MKKIIAFMLVFVCFVAFADDAVLEDGFDTQDKTTKDKKKNKGEKEVSNTKITDFLKANIYSKTSVEFEFVDMLDDNNETSFSVAKNTPTFTEEFEAFIKINKFKNDKFIFGPYVYAELQGKMDYKSLSSNKDKNQFIFEKFRAIGYTGVQIGTKFGNYAIENSSISFILPFMMKFNVNDRNDNIAVPSDVSYLDFFTNIYLGTNFAIVLDIKSKMYNFDFEFTNNFIIAGDLYKTNGRDASRSLYIEENSIAEFAVSPFNFINDKVDVSLAICNKNEVSYNGDYTYIDNKLSFEIVWDGLKYFAIQYKPIIYNFEIYYLIDDATLKDQYQSLSTEIGVSFGNKILEVGLTYEPTFWVLDKDITNADTIREHSLKADVKLKF